MNKLFTTNDKIKMSSCNKSIHKAMIIPVNNHQTNNNSVLNIKQKMNVNWNLQIISKATMSDCGWSRNCSHK